MPTTRRSPGASAQLKGLRLAAPALAAALAAACVAYPALASLATTRGKLLAATAALLAAVAYARFEAARSWLLGAAAERLVSRRLRGLELRGWTVVHDVPKAGGGNVDHIAAGPRATFTIETKRSRFAAADLAQARSHARWLGRRGRDRVVPVLCVARSSRERALYAGVWCVGGSGLAPFLASYRPAVERKRRAPPSDPLGLVSAVRAAARERRPFGARSPPS